jgi:hypothetical protein
MKRRHKGCKSEKGTKGLGFEYWGKRAGGRFNGGSTGGKVKRDTNRYERRKAKQEMNQ